MALNPELLENLRLVKTFHFDKGDLNRMHGWRGVYMALPAHIQAPIESVWDAERALEIANGSLRRALDDEIDSLED